MKLILQNIKTGDIEVVEAPIPAMKSSCTLIRTRSTLISAGTERMLLEFGKSNLLNKARQQPDKVRQILDKVKTDGLLTTINAVSAKLDEPLPLGYCNVGTIVDADKEILMSRGLSIGDRVVSNGPHAEYVCVPKNLCAKAINGVSDEEAVFAVPGAIALQGIRLAQPTIGEFFVVIGLGLIGLLAVQILLANGCQVMGVDLDSAKCRLAQNFGAQAVDISAGEDNVEAALNYSAGRGVDGVLITAATKSNEPVQQAARMCRKRGRIVLVGVTGLELRRSDFYEKELTFQVSCSYGPGRYDLEYEEKGHDYPFGYIRWTEGRNLEAVLNLLSTGKLDVKPLISHRFPFDSAGKAYGLISKNKEPYLGIILNYRKDELCEDSQKRVLSTKVKLSSSSIVLPEQAGIPVIAMIGSGNYARQVLLPAIVRNKVKLKAIASETGISGTHLGKKFGFEITTTDTETIFSDPEINTVFIGTRHNTHALLTAKAIEAGKNVFVEKPFCLTLAELNKLVSLYHEIIPNASIKTPIIMVGFNRRFAPHVEKMRELMASVKQPKSMVMTVNAGSISGNHWTQDPGVGGGRIIGEACHFVDLLRFLAGCEISQSKAIGMKHGMGDTLSIMLTFADGSIGTIHYFANGHRAFPKEKLEVFCAGRILKLDNFKRMRGYGWEDFKKMNLWKQDKGHSDEIRSFLEAVRNETSSPISFAEIVEVTEHTLKLASAHP
jgi:predicted dehydrogenase